MRFSDYIGLFIYHCHNLEHEDMGMIKNFKTTKKVHIIHNKVI